MSPYAGPCRLGSISLTVPGSLCRPSFGSDYIAMECLVEDEFFPNRSKNCILQGNTVINEFHITLTWFKLNFLEYLLKMLLRTIKRLNIYLHTSMFLTLPTRT